MPASRCSPRSATASRRSATVEEEAQAGALTTIDRRGQQPMIVAAPELPRREARRLFDGPMHPARVEQGLDERLWHTRRRASLPDGVGLDPCQFRSLEVVAFERTEGSHDTRSAAHRHSEAPQEE